MKKKLLSFLLTVALALSLAPAALALGAFADVTDAETARNVEVLRLMRVLEGDGAGAFRPNSSLTRAEFCKMTVVLTGKRNVVVSYAKRDVGFRDMKASHWAAGYVNYAASKEAGLIHGLPDGTFAPNRAITYGEAVAILTRLLGYTDKDAGSIWPDGYLALASAAGMTKGLSLGGNATITRAQAAKLFVNALTAENSSGVTLLSLLGYSCDTTKKPLTIWSIDLVNGTLRLSDGTKPEMAEPMDSAVLVGVKGHVVTNAAGKVVTFLPSASESGSGGTVRDDAAVVVGADGSTAGFDALTGGAAGYSVYRNGVAATTADLKQGDVVIYSASANAILACDTRVAAYYEGCAPTPAAPNTITVLGGTELSVLPTAQQSLSQYKPGENLTLLLTADGRVAGAAESGSGANAYAYVGDSDAQVSLLCGGSLIELKLSGTSVVNANEVHDSVVRVTQTGGGGKSSVYLSKQTGVGGDLDPVKKTLGARALTDGALVISGGELTSLQALGETVVPEGRIAFARANKSGEVDLIVVKDNSGEHYGRVTVHEEGALRTITVDFGKEKGSETKESNYGVKTGDFVSFDYGSGGAFINMAPLTRLPNVAASAWIGDSVVNYGGATYVLSEQVICYNRDGGSWFDDLEAARAYGGKLDLYVKDGTVHVIEVHS